MLVTPQETFLELEEAADALGMHPVTLRERAAPATNNLEATRPKRFDSASAHNWQTCRGPVGTDGGFPVGNAQWRCAFGK